MLKSLWRKACKKSVMAVLSFFLVLNGVYAQKTHSFPHSAPEAQGVTATAIDSFLNAVGRSNHEFHSIMILRHGKVVAEGWWNPYQPTLRHSLYSLSKSFTSTAIGFAINEKLLKLDDKVVSFFPNSLPGKADPYLAQLSIRNLLSMTAGQDPDPTVSLPFKTDDWVKGFLATPIVHEPGTKFLYNTMATFMLSAVVEKVTGQKVVDYLKPRLFNQLGIHGEDWEVNNQGINTGGWGLRLKTEDLAKMGEFYLQKGEWNGKQLLPKEWIEQATSFKIDQAPGAPQSKKDSSDWMQGYCYQFWRCRHNCYRGDGAFGQYIIVMPDQDAVIAITSETPDMQGELNLVWQYLLPAMHPTALPENQQADAALQQHLEALSLPPLPASTASPSIGELNNKTFTFKSNKLNIKSINLSFEGQICHVALTNESAAYKLNFASGKWMGGETGLQGPSLLNGAHENFSILVPYKVEGSYTWVDNNTLQLKLQYIESPHSEIITCHLEGKKLNATVDYSFAYGKNRIDLPGSD